MRNLRDKVIVITGASSGIGAATATACAQAGMHVALAARRVDRLQAVAAEIERIGRRALVIRCDVDRDQPVAALFDQTQAAFGRVDAVFANAGYGLAASVLDTTDAQVRAIFETNFHGTLRTVRAGIGSLRRAPDGLGHLLICSSAASEFAPPGHGVYAATKAAQDSIAGALRAELIDQSVLVTSVHPVGTATEFFDTAAARVGAGHGHQPGTPAWLTQQPEQVARAVVRALRRPRPEVWPSPAARFGLALTTACPRLAAWIARRMAHA